MRVFDMNLAVRVIILKYKDSRLRGTGKLTFEGKTNSR
jgi:hypothetical protein